ncbi:hypothetical protein GCM10010486_53250 [Nonomuraea roseoviolacea subsp. carminata]
MNAYVGMAKATPDSRRPRSRSPSAARTGGGRVVRAAGTGGASAAGGGPASGLSDSPSARRARSMTPRSTASEPSDSPEAAAPTAAARAWRSSTAAEPAPGASSPTSQPTLTWRQEARARSTWRVGLVCLPVRSWLT